MSKTSAKIAVEMHNKEDLSEKLENKEEGIEAQEIQYYDRDPIDGGKGGAVEADLPHNLYTALMIIPLCQSLGENKYQNLLIWAQLSFMQMISMWVTVSILYYIKHIYEETEADVGVCGDYATETSIRVSCVGIYVIYCVSDLTETVKMFMFTLYFKSSDTFEALRYRVAVIEGSEEKEFATGMPMWYKMYIFCTVLVPKFSIATFLLVYGTGFVVTTDDNADVILNALALGFVIELDEMGYALLPSQMQECVEDLPSVPLAKGRMTKLNKEFGIFVKVFFILGLVAFTYLTFCPNLDGQPDDPSCVDC